jgi:tetratricopeptide (TPR) repeat protein
MRKLILSLILVAFATVAFAQKKVVRSAERNLKKGQYEHTLSDIETALQDETTGEDPNTYMVKGKIKTMMFEQDEANNEETVSTGRTAYDAFDKALEMDGGDRSSKLGKEIYQEVLPGMPEHLMGQGMMRLKQASLEKAIDRYEEDDMELAHEFFALVADIDPSDTSNVFNAGYTANMIEKHDAAKKYFTMLLDDEEYNKLNAYYFLIQIASSVDEDQDEAYRLVSQAREEYPEDKGLQEFEIQLLLQLDKMDEAMASIEQALQEDPDDTAIRLRYGYLKEQSGDLEGALEEYKKTVESDPDFFEGNYYAGAVYLDKARGIISEVNNLPDDEWEAKSEKMMKEADGLYESAIPYFTRASELQPENTEVLEILFQIHTRLKNTAKAEEYDQRLQELLGPDWMEG